MMAPSAEVAHVHAAARLNQQQELCAHLHACTNPHTCIRSRDAVLVGLLRTCTRTHGWNQQGILLRLQASKPSLPSVPPVTRLASGLGTRPPTSLPSGAGGRALQRASAAAGGPSGRLGQKRGLLGCSAGVGQLTADCLLTGDQPAA